MECKGGGGRGEREVSGREGARIGEGKDRLDRGDEEILDRWKGDGRKVGGESMRLEALGDHTCTYIARTTAHQQPHSPHYSGSSVEGS